MHMLFQQQCDQLQWYPGEEGLIFVWHLLNGVQNTVSVAAEPGSRGGICPHISKWGATNVKCPPRF